GGAAGAGGGEGVRAVGPEAAGAGPRAGACCATAGARRRAGGAGRAEVARCGAVDPAVELLRLAASATGAAVVCAAWPVSATGGRADSPGVPGPGAGG